MDIKNTNLLAGNVVESVDDSKGAARAASNTPPDRSKRSALVDTLEILNRSDTNRRTKRKAASALKRAMRRQARALKRKDARSGC